MKLREITKIATVSDKKLYNLATHIFVHIYKNAIPTPALKTIQAWYAFNLTATYLSIILVHNISHLMVHNAVLFILFVPWGQYILIKLIQN